MRPKEFWVSQKGSTWIDWDGPPNLTKDFYYAGGKTYHVIEKSAYDKLEKQNYNLKCEMQSYINAKEESQFNETQSHKKVKDLETKLKVAVEVLELIANTNHGVDCDHDSANTARQALKEME